MRSLCLCNIGVLALNIVYWLSKCTWSAYWIPTLHEETIYTSNPML